MAVAARAAGADPQPPRWALIDPALDAVARQARELELSPDEVLARLNQRMSQD